MPGYNHLVPITAARQYAMALTAADSIVRIGDHGRLCLFRRDSWTAIPAEDGRLAYPDFRRPLIQTMLKIQQPIYAVSLEHYDDYPPMVVPPSDPAIEELSRVFGVFPYVLVPETADWAILQTTNELMVFVGQTAIVERLFGSSVRSALDRYFGFANDGSWGSLARTYFAEVQTLFLRTYPNLKDDECTLLPSLSGT
jgi:hypothetical protein